VESKYEKKFNCIFITNIRFCFCCLLLWSQATKLPDWYVSKGVNSDKLINLSNEVEVQAVKTKLQEKIDTKIEDSINARQEVSPKLARVDGYEVNTDAPQNTQVPRK
jgi:hypothetical protein